MTLRTGAKNPEHTSFQHVTCDWCLLAYWPVALPGFIARMGKDGNVALTVNFRAGCSSCSITNSFVTNAVLIERAVSC